MYRSALVLVVSLLVATGCGDDDTAAVPSVAESAATTPATVADTVAPQSTVTAPPSTTTATTPATPATESTEPPTGSTDGTGAADVLVVGDDVCAVLAVEEVATLSGLDLVEARRRSGEATTQEIEYTTEGCLYSSATGDSEVVVSLATTADGDVVALYDALFSVSAERSLGDVEHRAVDGLGDRAFFESGLGSTELFVLTGDRLLVVEGEVAPREPLGEAEKESVAAAALVAIG